MNNSNNEKDEQLGADSPKNVSDLARRFEQAGQELKKVSELVRKYSHGMKNFRTASEIQHKTKLALLDLVALEKECQTNIESWKRIGERYWIELETAIKDVCAKKNWRIDGSWPSYMIAYGIELQINEKTEAIRIGDHNLGEHSLEAIESMLSVQVKTLLPAEFSPEDFLETLFLAYEDSKRLTSQVPVLDVYQAFVVRSQRAGFWRNARAEKFSEIRLDQFRARLSRILEENVIRTKLGSDLRLYPPIDSKNAIFMYHPIERRLAHVGRLEFSEKPNE